jgi:hypothetical protein
MVCRLKRTHLARGKLDGLLVFLHQRHTHTVGAVVQQDGQATPPTHVLLQHSPQQLITVIARTIAQYRSQFVAVSPAPG